MKNKILASVVCIVIPLALISFAILLASFYYSGFDLVLKDEATRRILPFIILSGTIFGSVLGGIAYDKIRKS